VVRLRWSHNLVDGTKTERWHAIVTTDDGSRLEFVAPWEIVRYACEQHMYIYNWHTREKLGPYTSLVDAKNAAFLLHTMEV